MANKLNISLLAFFLLLIAACDVMDSTKLKVYNYSRDTIFCLWATENSFKEYVKSPLEQSMKISGKDTLWTSNNNLLLPNDSSVFSSYNWKMSTAKSKDKQLIIFFFKLQTLQEMNWKELQEKVIYDKKVSLTIEDLEKLNWRVSYWSFPKNSDLDDFTLDLIGKGNFLKVK